jgi:acyl carrier protein
MTRDEILEHMRAVFAEMFEIDPARVTLDANMYSDLEIDSIDAVDLLDQVRRFTGKKVSSDDFRAVRTVGDLVSVIERLAAQ